MCVRFCMFLDAVAWLFGIARRILGKSSGRFFPCAALFPRTIGAPWETCFREEHA